MDNRLQWHAFQRQHLHAPARPLRHDEQAAHHRHAVRAEEAPRRGAAAADGASEVNATELVRPCRDAERENLPDKSASDPRATLAQNVWLQ